MSLASIPPAPLPALQDGTDALALAGGEEAFSLHRVDQPHTAPMETTAADALPADTTSKPAGLRDTISDAAEFDPERIRAAHAEDLISFCSDGPKNLISGHRVCTRTLQPMKGASERFGCGCKTVVRNWSPGSKIAAMPSPRPKPPLAEWR